MSGHFNEPFPRGPLLGVASLVLITLVGVGVVQFNKDDNAVRMPKGQVLADRAVRFEDAVDGSVLVMDDLTGVQIDALRPAPTAFCAPRCAVWPATGRKARSAPRCLSTLNVTIQAACC